MAQAVMNLHSNNAREVKLMELAEFNVPEKTRTYEPLWHLDMIYASWLVQKEYNWLRDPDRNPDQVYRTAISGDGGHMFYTSELHIDGLLHNELALAFGGRNSYDKSFAASFCFGISAFICSNLSFSGDLKVSSLHWTGKINLIDMVRSSFDQIPRLAKAKYEWADKLQSTPITAEHGVALLAEAVEKKALPIATFMSARGDFLNTYNGEETNILHPRTLWSVYQAATGQYKDIILYRNQGYNTKLETLVNNYMER